MRLRDVELDGSKWGMRWPDWESHYQVRLKISGISELRIL
jgi:hypothetical protein